MSNTALGAALTIDDSVLTKIQEAEEKIIRLEQTTRTSSDKIIKSFRSMGGLGVQYFIDKLKLAQNELSKINMPKIDFGQNINFGQVSQQATALANSVTSVSVAINQLDQRTYSTADNLAKLTKRQKELREELTKEEGLPLKGGVQQAKVNELESVTRAIKEQMKGRIQLSEEATKKEQQNDLVAYNAWLAQKDAELKRHLQVEDEKYKRTKAVIDEQLKMFAEYERKRAEWAKQNTTAKTSGDVVNANIRAQEKMYQEMFDKIAAMQKKKDEAALLSEQKKDAQIYNAWLAQKDAELKRHLQVEDEKYKRTKAVIDEQLKMFAELEKKKAEWEKQNASAKGSGERINREIREQEKAYERMFDEIARRQKQQAEEAIVLARRQYAEQAKLYQQQNLKQNTTYQGALSFAEGANTINRRTKAIQYLTQARAQLSSTDVNYAQKLKALNDAIRRMNAENERAVQGARNLAQQHSNLMNTSDQLARKLALIFSVSQIQGYVNKLVQVRGEFELQNTALASILQNKDQADKLFGQITELAVQSPFTVKELTTYTKSLAAYQFQYEELYDTTKRLADVASGLGVDMQRLILAVGQVKAAGYLRGTETRQFTEAGFNILGELAKYYSELEGRIVSVGEVQERQFKRMIAFQDVEEVFRRVTDAGGMFYQMQEKQAETLAGQMSNLKDSIDLMFNSIGEQNDGNLKDMVALFRSFIENWQEVVFVLKPAVTALGAWKTLTLLASIGNKQFALSLYAIATNAKTATASISLMTRATTALAAVGRGLMSVFAIAIPVALIAGIMELYRVSTKASREAKALKEALDGISKEGFIRASELISNFKVLAEKAVEAADGSKEQQEALEELERTYKDILPEEQLKIESLRELKGEYDNVTTAIYSKIEAQIKEKQIQEVSNTYGTAASESMDALAKRLTDYNISLSTAKTITNEFKKMLEQGMIKDANQAKIELENLIRLFSGQYASLGEQNIWQRLGWATGVDVIDEIDDAFNAFTRFNDEVKRLEGEPITPFRIGGGTEVYQSLKEELENIAKFKEDWEKQNKDKFKFKVEFNEESKNALISQYQKFIADLNSKISSGQIKQGDILSANLIIEEAQKAIEKLDVSPQIAQVNDLRVELSKLYGIDFEKFNFTKMLEGQGFNDFIKRLDEGIQDYKEIIEVFDEAARQGTEVPAMQQWALLQGKTIEEIRTLVPVLEEYRAKLALVTKEEDKKRGRDNTGQIFKQRLEFFERANKEYEKLLQNYSKEEARAKVISSMMDEAQQRGVGGIFMSAQFDEKGTLDSMNKVKAMYTKLSEEMRIAFAKAFGGIQLDMDIEVRQDRVKAIQDQFSDLFGNYELSLELENLGLDKEVASKLFNLDILDLSELKKKAETYKDELLNILGDDGVSAWEGINRRITEAEEKELEKRLKTFAEYLKKTVNETKKIQTQVGKDISFAKLLFSGNKIDASQYVEIISQIQKKANEELSKIAVDKFKESPEYIKAMGDMSIYTKKELERLSQQLQRLISESASFSDASDLKVYQDALEKVNEQINKIQNPFNESFIGEIQRIKELQEEYNLELERYNELLRERDLKTASLKDAEKQLALLQEKRQNGDNSLSLLGQIQNVQKGVQVATQGLSNVNNQLNISQGNLSNISSSMGDIMQGTSGIIGMIDKIVEGVYQSINATIGMFNEIKELASSFGAEVGEGAWSDLTIAMESLGQINENVMGAWESFKSGDILGAVTKSVGAVFSVIKGINSLFDNKREKEIKKQIEQVENLQKSYEKLKEAIDSAYSIDTLEKSTDQAIANLEERNRRYQEMIAAEKDKKKTDDDRVKEWEEAIIANNEEIAALLEESVSTATSGIFDELLSAANDFTDAWLESFKEIGNGMDGLEQSFQEMLTNMVKQQATMLITNTFLDNWKKQLEQYVNADDLKLTSEEAKKWVDAVKEDLPALNEALENYFKAMGESGLDLSGEGGDTMSTLQKGIQGVTEETAQALEALLNSMRYFVSDSNLQLRSILATLTAPAPENPFLLELKAQTEQLRTMNSLWNSLSKTSTGNGKVLKVQIV